MPDCYITSADNDRIKLYRRLYLDKRYRRKEGLFVLEGARLVSDAAGVINFHSVFFTEDARKRYNAAYEKISAHSRICVISDDIADTISGTDNPQGVYAILRSPEEKPISDIVKDTHKAIILDNIQDPGNMGTMLRTADACGIDLVVLCECCDELSPKVVRSAMGSIMRVRISHSSFEDAVSSLKEVGYRIYAAVIGDGLHLGEFDFAQKSAVIIGNEGNGIPEKHAKLADDPMTIKMHGTVNSLNAAMAAGIIMWELSRYE
ncbi:MAG: RNA methyltransferase [Oscillospiraceae bacterium]|nr:RNA methyltransferase [Oscillospiraceae bacterium]